MTLGCSFYVDKRDLHHTGVHPAPAGPDTVPERGGALLRVDRFGFSANNITYAVFGDAMHYWDFFPAPDGWGQVPVWGFATVVRSTQAEIPEGARFFGYYPMSTHLEVRAGEISDSGFTDVTPHRSTLPPVYNRYLNTASDPGYARVDEDVQMLLRPLFMTSFLLENFLADNSYFGADAVVVTSASSKTAFGLAHLLAARQGKRPAVVGLTSSANVGFVEDLGCYDRVLAYQDAPLLPGDPTALVDFAGNQALISALHTHLADALTYSGIVGGTHWDAVADGTAMDTAPPGPGRSFFFAPDQVERRRDDWGPGGVEQRVAAAWRPFVDLVRDKVTIVEGAGPNAVTRVYDETIRGLTSPDVAHVLSMWGDD